MPWGIKFATVRAVRDHGEHSDDADIWVVGFRYEKPFATEALAQKFCDDQDADSDGMLVHRPIELKEES